MAGSLGELFIQLAFEGDTKGADKFIKKTQEIIDLTDKEIKKNKLRIQYLQDLAQTQDKTQKKLLTDNYVKEFKKLNLTEQLNNAKNKQLEQKNAVIGTAKAFAGYIAAISGAIYAVKKLTDSLITQNQTWVNLTRTSDIALSTFQKWNAIGRMYGIDNAAQQIKNLNDRLFELKLTGAGAQGFMLAGINPTNADDVMEQLRGRVSGLDDTAASYLLRQMGIDENMLHILRLGREEFKALNAEVKRFQLTPDQRRNIQEMNVQLQIASMKLQYLKDRAVLAILPAWTKFIQGIAAFAANLKTLTVSLAIFSIRFIPFSKIFASLPKIFTAIVSKMPVIKSFLVRIGAVLARYLLPLTAIYLLVDDIMGYFEGKNSAIGYVINAWKDFQKNGIFSDEVPRWIQLLVRAADTLNKVFGGGQKKPEMTADEALRGGFSQEDYNALIERGNRLKAERLHNSIISPQTERAIDNSITNNNTSNAPKIEFNQHVDINSSQPARDTYNEFQNGLFFANNTLARGAAI